MQERWFPSGVNLKGFLKEVAGEDKDLDQWNLEQEHLRPLDSMRKGTEKETPGEK